MPQRRRILGSAIAISPMHIARARLGRLTTGVQIVKIKVFAVKAWRDVSGLLAALQLPLKFLENLALNLLPAGGIDGMRNVGMEFQPLLSVATAILLIAVFVEAMAAMIAVAGAQMVLFIAMRAMIGKLAGGHRQEKAIVPVDQLHIPHDERVIEGQRAEGLESATALAAKIDANLG